MLGVVLLLLYELSSACFRRFAILTVASELIFIAVTTKRWPLISNP